MPVVSVVNMKGGVAKTTLAINLADVLVRREDCTVLVIDLDPQFNATQALISPEDYVARRQAGGHTIVNVFDDAPAPTISAIAHASKPALALKDIAPWKVKESFDILPGALELYRLEMGGGQGREQRLKRYLQEIDAENAYDFVIIDTPPTPSHWMMAALLASTGYIVPVKAEPLSRTGIDLLKGVIDRCSQNFGHPITCYGLVLTIVEINTNVFRDAKALLDNDQLWQGKRFENVLPKRTAVAAAQGQQQLILDLPDDVVKRALTGIGQEFLERVNADEG
jgi:chromosome partitioning protein